MVNEFLLVFANLKYQQILFTDLGINLFSVISRYFGSMADPQARLLMNVIKLRTFRHFVVTCEVGSE